VIYEQSQQTLHYSWPELDALVVSLGPFYACAWCALERSTRISAPVAADPQVVRQLLVFLQSAGVLSHSAIPGDRTRRSLYDPVSWIYRDSWHGLKSLESALLQALSASRPNLDAETQQWLWRQLSDREISAYLTSLLRRHRIGIHRAGEVLGLQDNSWAHLSLGRKRYVAWSSMRRVASQSIGTAGHEEDAVRVLSSEMRNRARWLFNRETAGKLRRTDFCFLPDSTWRRPLMLDVALESILTIGNDYWLAAPSLPNVGSPHL